MWNMYHDVFGCICTMIYQVAYVLLGVGGSLREDLECLGL